MNNTVNVEGVQFSGESLEMLKEMQEDDLECTDTMLDCAIYHLANPDAGMDDRERLSVVGGLLDFKRQLHVLKTSKTNER